MYRFLLLFALCSSPALADSLDIITYNYAGLGDIQWQMPASQPPIGFSVGTYDLPNDVQAMFINGLAAGGVANFQLAFYDAGAGSGHNGILVTWRGFSAEPSGQVPTSPNWNDWGMMFAYAVFASSEGFSNDFFIIDSTGDVILIPGTYGNGDLIIAPLATPEPPTFTLLLAAFLALAAARSIR